MNLILNPITQESVHNIVVGELLTEENMVEETRPVVIDGVVVPGYFVSNTGSVYSAWRMSRERGRIRGKIIDTSRLKLLKPEIQKDRDTGAIKCLRVNLVFEDGLFPDDYKYTHSNKSTKRQRKKGVHQLVMMAFRPVDLYPPEQIAPYWETSPEPIKQWIRDTVVVNHINHDPFVNALWNLEYTTPKGNSRKAVEYYDGNLSNKKSFLNNTVVKPKQETSPLFALIESTS